MYVRTHNYTNSKWLESILFSQFCVWSGIYKTAEDPIDLISINWHSVYFADVFPKCAHVRIIGFSDKY